MDHTTTPYEQAIKRLRQMVPYDLPDDWEPSIELFVMDALKYDWSQDGLYLCKRGCGITWDHECDYGGWHNQQGDALIITTGTK